MRLQLAVLPVPRHLQPVFSPAAFPKAAAKPSATDRPAYCRDSRRSNCQLFRSWWKLPALKPPRGHVILGTASRERPARQQLQPAVRRLRPPPAFHANNTSGRFRLVVTLNPYPNAPSPTPTLMTCPLFHILLLLVLRPAKRPRI